MNRSRLDGGQFINLHTFFTAARYLSFSRAADELCLTPSAVSHRIARLERSLGLRLFLRLTRQVRLTPDGERLFAALARGMDELETALQPDADERPAGRLALHVHPSILQCWLIPRLAGFAELCPQVELDIRAGNGDANFRSGRADLALYYADGHFPGLSSHKLMSEEMAPVCSPDYAERHRLRDGPAQLRDCSLLHDSRAWYHAAHNAEWTQWARHQGCEVDLPSRSLSFDRSDLCLSAAASGAGVAIGRRHLAQQLIDEGRLVLPLSGFLSVGHYGYYLVHPPGPQPARLRAFVDWLLLQAAA
ncbi:DNA-binding transcriptional regulator DsdC [Chromobacterium sp. ATCC 53434]|uniref:DNA-binding transcriptional regulator DsdC n=1 Tax=Chromobacterium TaxID=535 RepID=UPI000C789D45|nr:DNA-binding transcriptional regulator DsdC [Chromobacterium sp. ATCC 53434]AUH51416.1 DNA-binding transcriptional regulator DsdC [Chromobacterium sp. ATCC 53434]